MKVDIKKVFDSINGLFLMHVLKKFGFNDTFTRIWTMLNSSKISFSFNGKIHVFFDCGRGARQGDPFSPILFCIAEEVLNRSLTNLVTQNIIKLIPGLNSLANPSHCLFVDDVMIFCRGNKDSIVSLITLFFRYARSSGQVMNPHKSFIFAGVVTNSRLHHIANRLRFKIGHLPFSYLGVPILKDKPKAIYLRSIMNKVNQLEGISYEFCR